MKKLKFSIIKIARVIVQTIFFIFLPMLYINAFSGIQQMYLALINQSFNLAQQLPQLVSAISIIPLTMLLGRFFCGWLCAFGAMGDLLYAFSKNVLKNKFKINEKVDQYLKYLKYVVLLLIVVLIWTMNSKIFMAASPWDAFGMLFTVGRLPALSFVATNLLMGLVFIGLIIAGSLLVERFFCRYLCPLGAVFALTSGLRIAKIKKVTTDCGKCRMCTKNCSMGIPLYTMDKVDSGECIQCMKCVSVCPRKNVTLTITEQDVRPLIVSAVAVSLMTGFYYAGSFAANAVGLPQVSAVTINTNAVDVANRIYKDGVYEGSGIGFSGATTTVKVTIKNDQINSITTISSGDDPQFYDRAFTSITNAILSSQSSAVDSVSGATYSSQGIMQAVANALGKAKVSGGVVVANGQMNNKTQSQNNSASAVAINIVDSANTSLTDGTYQGIGSGFNGSTKVSVNITNGKIDQISTISTGDTPEYYKKAFSRISSAIIKKQAAKVDAVSGATYSSRGIMQAVANALGKAGATSAQTAVSVQPQKKPAAVKVSATTGVLSDGTYQGTGSGFNGSTKVSVKIQAGKITNISTISTGDTREYYNTAFPSVSSAIISRQTAKVDAVSGATYSSRGIMQAVASALGKAGATSAQTAVTTKTPTKVATTKVSTTKGVLADGTYQGTGSGFNGNTTVSVTVKNGKVTSISTISTGDTNQFYNSAFPTVSNAIISRQTANVDAVSGATYSSQGIMQAVANALGKAGASSSQTALTTQKAPSRSHGDEEWDD
ncbi:MAG: FMN-binding protein [Clostridia bacterium]